jgi:hypothetical protein
MIKNFPNQNATPIIGQPVTILRWLIPVTVEFTCNCPVPDTVIRAPLLIQVSQPVMCPHCRMVYSAGYDPNGEDRIHAVRQGRTGTAEELSDDEGRMAHGRLTSGEPASGWR